MNYSGKASKLRLYNRKSQDDQPKVNDISQAIEKGGREDVNNLSSIDFLTGVYSREGPTPTIQAIFNKGKVIKRNLVILLFDIDGLERINKRKGRDFGDLVIREIATLVKLSIRSHDIVGRWSGEEFILLSTHTEIEAGRNLAEKIRSMVQNHTFKEDRSLNFTVSIGLTAVKEDETFEQSFARATEALVAAKNAGRNHFVIL